MKFKSIAVEGPIGVGKTTFVELLARKFDAHRVLEDVNNPFLKDFYQDRPGTGGGASPPQAVTAPPAGAVPAARQAYTRLHGLASAVTAAGGLLCASSCSSHFGKDDFLASIEAGARQAGRRWDLEALFGAAFDHPVLPAFPEGDYLKFAIGRVH